MPAWRWTLYDPNLTETFEFEYNPSEGGFPSLAKNVTSEGTVAPDGRIILYEGARAAQEIDWKGVFLTKDERDNFIAWYEKPYQVKLTDDLGEERWIYIDRLVPVRKHVVNREVKYEYTLHAYVVNVP